MFIVILIKNQSGFIFSGANQIDNKIYTEELKKQEYQKSSEKQRIMRRWG